MSLALLEQELDDIHVQLQRLRPANTIEGRGRWSRLSDTQGWSLAEWDDLGDGRVAIEHGDGLTLAYCP